MRYLEESKWLDKFTLSVFIDFVLYNPNVNLFIPVKLAMEHTPASGAVVSHQIVASRFDRYSAGLSYLVYLGEVVFILMTLSYMRQEVHSL